VTQLELDHFLTLHLRSRKFPSISAYIETVRVLAALSSRVAGRPLLSLSRPKVHPTSTSNFEVGCEPA